MKLRIIILNLLLISISTACIKRDFSEFTDTPIIESYLRPGDYLNIKVSRQTPYSADVKYSEDNIDLLNIKVLYNNKTYTLTPLGDGNYIDSSLIVKEGETYNLSFTFNAKNVTAYTQIPIKPMNFKQSANSISVTRISSTSGMPAFGPGSMPEPITLTWDNDDESYYIVIIENTEATLDPIRDFGDAAPPGNRFRKMPTTASGLQLRPQEFQYFGKHRLILYHVLPDYASLYSEKTTSSQNLTNPSTSIMNGYGIFTGLNSDTLYLNVYESK
jgi:hypothetical protein